MAAKRKKSRQTSLLAATSGAIRRVALADGRRLAVAAVWLLGAAGFSTAWVMGVPKLEGVVAADRRAASVTVTFTDLPAWVNGDLLAMLELTARRELDGDPFDREGLLAVRGALLDTGWFDAVHQVQRLRPDLVRVDAAFVRPAAVFRDRDGDHLVDVTGRLLPRTFPHGGAKRQLVVVGAHFDRPQAPGVQWDGADVTAALRLLRLVDGKPWRDQIASIDTGRYLTEETLVIVTDHGARIIWGSAPGDETGLELPAERKLAYLDKAHAEYRRIDTGYAGSLHFYERGYFAE